MKQTIILHIGRHKSGTSSLQKFFCDNEFILESLGYFYPKKLRRPIAHHPLAKLYNKNLAHTLTTEDLKEIDEFWQEIEGKQNIIISSEAFQNVDPLKMKAILKDFNLKIVIYLREQINYILSSYAQAIKAQKITLTLEEYEATIFKDVDYLKFIKKWKNAFPESEMIIRPFEKSLLIGNDIRKDFLVHSKIVNDKNFQQFEFFDEDKNPSIGGSLLEFKRLLNATDYDQKIKKGKLYRILQNLSIKYKKYQLQKIIPANVYLIMKNKYEKSNKVLSEEYVDFELKITENITFGNQQYLDEYTLDEIFHNMEKEDKQIASILKNTFRLNSVGGGTVELLNKRKLVILGTSNSLLRNGYTHILQESFELKNYSIGASCSGAGLYSSLEFEDYIKNKVCLIDFNINDHAYLITNVLSKEHLLFYIESLIQKLLSIGCIPIIVVFPRRTLQNSYAETEIFKHNSFLASKYELTVINGYQFLQNISQQENIKNSLFSDDIHLNSKTAQVFGEIIKHKVVANYSDSKNHLKEENNFYNYSAKSMASDLLRLIEIGSSIRKENAIVLSVGDKLIIDIDGYLCGFLIDTNNSAVHVKVSNDEKVVCKNFYSPKMLKGKIQFKYIPLFTPMKSNGKICIEVVDKNESITEKTHGETPIKNENKLFLCGVLCCKKIWNI